MRVGNILLVGGLVVSIAVLGRLPAPAQEEPAAGKKDPKEANAQQDEESTIRVDVNVVNILATVRDKKERLVNSLTKDDFQLEENGVPQKITYFSQQTDLPLTIGLLVDTSVSQERLIDVERSASFQFFQQTLRNHKDLAFLISFDVDVELLQDLTDSINLLHQGLEQLEIQGAAGGVMPGPVPTSGRVAGTVMYDAIYLASDEMLKHQVGRKAVVLVTDGNDYGSRLDLDQALEAAHRGDVVIYGIRYFDREFYFRAGAMGGGGYGTLKKLGRDTGGNVFEVSKKKPLKEIFDEIQAELRSQYSIGYTPTGGMSGSEFRKIELTAKDKSLKVSAREGYYPKGS
jgi:VWFA-related protein